MNQTITFDIYGTLIDPMALGQELYNMLGERASSFNKLWREKQLEYSFRKAAMNRFNHFSECTRQALDYCDEFFRTDLGDINKKKLTDMYRMLPAYPETTSCLRTLKDAQFEIVALSNGKKEDLISLFSNAGIIEYFDQILSVDSVKTFKPDPAVYEMLVQRSHSSIENTWMVSSNAFDVIGASSCGLKTIWVKRSPDAIFDPFGIPYTYAVASLNEVPKLF